MASLFFSAKKRSMSQPLIMTATIKPPANAPSLQRTDPQLRTQDYYQALQFYLSQPSCFIDRVIFVENSASDLTPLRELVDRQGKDKDVEFISLNGLDYPPEYGRAYGEFKLMEYAIENSRILQALAPDDTFWKVTGRLMLLNINRLITTAPHGYDAYLELKKWSHRVAHIRAYSCTISGFTKIFGGIAPKVRKDIIKTQSEVFLFNYLMNLPEPIRIVPRFRHAPRYKGVGATTNRDYYGGSARVKYYARAVLRYIAPSLWV